MTKTNLSGYNILLVDDVMFSRETVVRLLRAMGNPNIHEAENGREALDVLAANPAISFVISDFNMPVMNGLEFLKSVRAGTGAIDRALPFALLTGYSDKHLVEMALALDVNAFLIKPVSKATLSKRLGRMISVADGDDWIRDPAHYGRVPVIGEEPAEAAPLPAAAASPAPQAATAPKDGATVLGTGRPAWSRAEPARKASKVSSLNGRFDETELTRDIADGVDRLVEQSGQAAASSMIGVLEKMEKKGVFTLDDLAGVFRRGQSRMPIGNVAGGGPPPTDVAGTAELKSLDQVREGSLLAKDIRTTDGSLFISVDTVLSGQILEILHHLSDQGVLALERDGDGNGTVGLFVRSPAEPKYVPDTALEIRVTQDDIPEGSRLTRDLFLSDGRLYMHAGSDMTARVISLIRDLYDLGNIEQPVHVVDGEN